MAADVNEIRNGDRCRVVAGTHAGKAGTVEDLKSSKTGAKTITVRQDDGVRFKTLARSVTREPA
ncbi:MAG: RNA-binding protein [Sphingomonas sp.]|uniref:KOW motif-containing protein n=1 Tax=Sphingomonas sp. TaxID=28214 RepID=UPI0011F79D9E|nr:KOW motif-containing protein [Sphingomonas sp.]THD34488.1 MAG: RNA-binding protein [Sphingomonas sp.]